MHKQTLHTNWPHKYCTIVVVACVATNFCNNICITFRQIVYKTFFASNHFLGQSVKCEGFRSIISNKKESAASVPPRCAIADNCLGAGRGECRLLWMKMLK